MKNNNFDGDVSVGRNLATGGDANIQGSATIGHNLKVKGWLEADNIKDTCKGMFETVEKLRLAYPLPKDGWWALVGDSLPAKIYLAEAGEWNASGGTSGLPTLDSQQLEEILGNFPAMQEDISNNKKAIDQTKESLSALQQQHTLDKSALDATIATEQAERSQTDLNLQKAIDAEVQSRTSEDNAIKQKLATETLNRQAGDNSLDGKITAETTARTDADTALGKRIDNLSTAMDNGDQELHEALRDEEHNRQSADTKLGERITTLENVGAKKLVKRLSANYVSNGDLNNPENNLELISTLVDNKGAETTEKITIPSATINNDGIMSKEKARFLSSLAGLHLFGASDGYSNEPVATNDTVTLNFPLMEVNYQGDYSQSDTGTDYVLKAATATEAGLMSSDDKNKLDAMENKIITRVLSIEETIRQDFGDADTGLGNRITTETTARTEADTAINAEIATVRDSVVGKKSKTWNGFAEVFNNIDENKATADCAHAEGHQTTASEQAAHAEGKKTVASSPYAHAEGDQTQATASSSHSEGYGTRASGYASHAEGGSTVASGNFTHAGGEHTKATNYAEQAIGYYNKSTYVNNGQWKGDSESTLFSVGNGTSESDRKNALEIKQDGTVLVQKPGTKQTVKVYDGLMTAEEKASLEQLPTQLTAEQTARVQADKTLQTNIDALKATATADANGLMSKEDKAKFDEMKTITPYAEDLQSYGIEIPKPSVATSKVRRIGNMEMHRTLPIQSKMRGCLLDDDGNVVEYLPDNDWTTAVRDGSKGQVMVELPEHWERFYINEQGLQCVRISELNLPGYFFVPKMFISAYNASLQRSTNRLCSVVNKDVDYRGGNNLAEYDGQYNSLLGMPVTAVSRGKFRDYARNRNAGKTTEWNCYLYEAYRILTWFYIIEYADRNVQQAFNAEKTPEGFAQGGLGEAIAIGYSDWGTYNKYNPFIPCGYTDEFGNRSGAKQLTISDNADFTHTRWVPRYRGVESFFADLWLWCDGVNIKVSPTVENGGDNTSKVYVCKDKSKFNETNYDGYEYLCDEAREAGIVTDIHFGKRGDIIATVVGGKSYADNYCDYHYVNTENKEEALRGLLLGGYVASGAAAGLAISDSGYAPAFASATLGSRLCFSPASANHDTNPI